ncbi:MAG: G8 domain-containing protein [Thermaceae bacterium]|nr:G8 domain-containing protein [Thermaceae bacterium]
MLEVWKISAQGNRRVKGLLWLVLLVGLVACSKASIPPSGGTTPPARSGLWSDPNTWGGSVPKAGDIVTIPADLSLTLDVSPPALKGLDVEGWLTFADKDLSLSSDWIMVHGKFQIGSADKPYRNRAIITLTGLDPSGNALGMGMGTKLIGVMGGTLELFGEPRNGWTHLTATAAKGATQIQVENAADWRVGDHIVLASTDYTASEAEEKYISAKNANVLTLDSALQYAHFGEVTYGVDERGEVGLLSRNITIQGDATTGNVKDYQNSAKNKLAGYGFGAHVMAIKGSQMRISGVEFTRVGQKQMLGRYPIHFHLFGDASSSYIRQNSIWNSFNRCVTIHGAQNLEVSGNVAYENLGHCYFMEDGAETGNQLVGNLGLLTLPSNPGEEVVPTDSEPATFWITNPNNVLKNNVAAGSEYANGFWLAFPQHPTGASRSADNDKNVWPQRTPLGEFSGNVAHSNGNGLLVDRGPDINTLKPGDDTVYNPRTYPAQLDKNGNLDDNNSTNPPVIAQFSNFTAYKNRSNGIWLRGVNHQVTGAKLADNAIGITMASDKSTLEGSLVVGTTDNRGTPQSWEKTGADGRTLPRPYLDTNDSGNGYLFPIRGFEFYDGQVGFKNVSFVNFQPLALSDGNTREAGAISYLRFTAFSIDSSNFAQGATFSNAKAVYFPPRAEPSAAQIAQGDNADGYRAAAFVDSDGSVTGKAGYSVVINNPFLLDSNCTAKPDWNAQICNYPYGRISIQNVSNTDNGASAALAPVSLTRLDGSNPVYRMWGVPSSGPTSYFQATIIAGRSYSMAYANALPGHLRIVMSSRKRGDFLRVNLPFSGTPNIYRDYYIADGPYGGKLTTVSSASAVDSASQSAYYYDGSTLYLKIMIPPTISQYDSDPNRDWANLEICHSDLCK